MYFNFCFFSSFSWISWNFFFFFYALHQSIYMWFSKKKKKINFFHFYYFYLFLFYFFFTLCMKKLEHKAKAGAETCNITNEWLVHMLSLFWSELRKIVDLSHMCGKLYVCTRKFGLYFILQINKVVAITTTAESCNQCLCYRVETFIILVFSLYI